MLRLQIQFVSFSTGAYGPHPFEGYWTITLNTNPVGGFCTFCSIPLVCVVSQHFDNRSQQLLRSFYLFLSCALCRNTTAQLPVNITATALASAIEALGNVDHVTVTRNVIGPPNLG